MPITELLKGVDLGPMHARMAGLMAAEGLEWTPAVRAYDTRLAQELGLWADVNGGPSLHTALFRAVQVDHRAVDDPAVLLEVAVAEGHAPEPVRLALRERPLRTAVDRSWSEARKMGITGVPTYVVGRSGVVGAQPYEVLVRLVEQAGVPKRELH